MKPNPKIILLCFSFLLSFAVKAQNSLHNKSADSLQQTSSIDTSFNSQLDLIDLYNRIIKKSTVPRQDLKSTHLSALPVVGYSLQTGFAAVISANLGFYTEKHNHNTEKISSLLTSITYSQYRQIIFPVQTDIWFLNNKYNVITDWRYMKYPSTTFGLGGKSNINNGYTIDFNYAKFHQTVLRKVSNNFYAGIGYYYDYFWNVKEVNPPPGVVTDFQKYGLTNTVTASGIALRLLVDTRKNQINPDAGWYVNIADRPNFTFLGSDNNWNSLLLEFRRYFNIPGNSKNIFAIWSYNWLTISGKPPYLLLPSTGWDDFFNTARGYIQGRYRGRDMLYLETEYRFQLTNNGLLGGVIFANAQSFSKELSQQFQIIAPGGGVGIRIRLNKFSGANLCIDYGWGLNGSQGVAVNLGEVF
ncbi:MAG TPA: BamA/TamA family outer membrane protein [Puia sp.]|nr:BamA/TamA family outer membrane protein [Puia sp.]